MTKEYISRDTAIESVTADNLLAHFDSVEDMIEHRFHRAAERILASIPAADVVPVRHGTWIKADEQPYFRKHYHAKVCSECGKRKDGKWLYCPYCGSKNQDGGKDNG